MSDSESESRPARRGRHTDLGDIDVTTLTNEFVTLQMQIKHNASALAAMRKTAKEMNGRLLAVMKERKLSEVSAKGVTIQCTTKLEIKMP